MLEVAYRQEQQKQKPTRSPAKQVQAGRISRDSQRAIGLASTSSPLHNMSAPNGHPHHTPQKLTVPLQIKPLKAPSSPLATHEPVFARGNDADLFKKVLRKDSTAAGQASSSKSATAGDTNATAHAQVTRIRRGQKLEQIQSADDTLLSLQQIDSPFQLQEYLAMLVRHNPHDVERIVSLPNIALGDSFMGAKGKGKEDFTSDDDPFSGAPGGIEEEPHAVDTDVWVYEQLRRIVADFTSPWLIALQRECDRRKKPTTCEAMNADDWMYLCASHGEEKQCCAIDYIIHTLDGTTALLNSHRHFPSRTYIPATSLRHFGSVARRLSRIFVHAYEHHREVYESCEAETSLYARFLTLVQQYDLIATDSLPKLGAAVPSKSGRDAHALAEHTPVDESVADSQANDDDFKRSDLKRPSPSASRSLFDDGSLSSALDDAVDEEDENEDGASGVEKAGQGETSAMHSPNNAVRTRRSDSNASRITAIHVGPDDGNEESGAKDGGVIGAGEEQQKS